MNAPASSSALARKPSSVPSALTATSMSWNQRSLPCELAMCWSVRHSVHWTGRLSLRASRQQRDELRVRADLVAEAAADVLRDEAQLVEAAAHRRSHHDEGEAGELVVREERPLRRAAVVLDERARGLERRGREAVEVHLLDADDVVRLRERPVDVAVLVEPVPDEVAAGVVVQHGRVGVERPPRVRDRLHRLVLDLDQLGGVACQLPRLRHHGDDRVADPPHAADGERVVLDVRARAATRSGRTGRSGWRPRRPSASRTRPPPRAPSRRRWTGSSRARTASGRTRRSRCCAA